MADLVVADMVPVKFYGLINIVNNKKSSKINWMTF